MEKKIIGFLGHREAGKDSATHFIYGQMLMKHDMIDSFQIGEYGELFVPIITEQEQETEEKKYGQFRINDHFDNLALENYLEVAVWPFVKKMAFADPLKIFCMDWLGIPAKFLWGNNLDKEELTKYKKSQLPIFNEGDMLACLHDSSIQKPLMKKEFGDNEPFLTVRELLQLVGTELFRKIDENYWVNFNKRLINETESSLIIVPDVRFENEIDALHELGGEIIYLTRRPHKKDVHKSEAGISKLKNKVDFVIDNEELTLEECHAILENHLREKGIL